MKKNHWRWTALLAAFLLSCAGAWAEGRLRVELDVFSGRPNPSFLLNTEDPERGGDSLASREMEIEKDIRRVCTGEAAAGHKADYPTRLRYRGIRISRQVGQDTYRPAVDLYRGTQRVTSAGADALCGSEGQVKGDAYYRDANSRLEKKLVGIALEKGVIPETLYKRIIQEIEAR